MSVLVYMNPSCLFIEEVQSPIVSGYAVFVPSSILMVSYMREFD